MAAMLAAATWATAVAQVAVGWLVVLIAVAATKAECKAVLLHIREAYSMAVVKVCVHPALLTLSAPRVALKALQTSQCTDGLNRQGGGYSCNPSPCMSVCTRKARVWRTR